MSATWWVRRGDVSDGPFTVDQLKQKASNGTLDRKAEIRLGKTTQWVEAQRMGWLSEDFETTSQAMTSPIPPEVPSAPVATPDLPSGLAHPGYFYAIIGTGINIILALGWLFILLYPAVDADPSVGAVAANDRAGNNTHEENIDNTPEPNIADDVDPTPPSDGEFTSRTT